jgi:uncharacterized protein YndB with AHSA1/START domain
MKYALYVLAALVALVLVIVAVGAMLPVKHRASRQVKLHQPPESVFALINDPAFFPAWRGKVKGSKEIKVEILPDRNGHRMFRESGTDGVILYEVESVVPNKRLVTRIADPSLPFGGKWTYEILPAGDSTTLRISEDGEVYNPLFRFVSRFIFGHNATIDQYLRDVRKRFGEDPAVVIQDAV